jgi:hypothetical protein
VDLFQNRICNVVGSGCTAHLHPIEMVVPAR